MTSRAQSKRVDVAILGGGPAGATAARLLARWGHSTVVLTRPAARLRLAESIPPSTRKLLAFLGLLKRMDAAGFYRTTGNTVWWGDSPGRSEAFSGAHGYQVPRGRLDRLLLDLAAEGGARIVAGATVRDVEQLGGTASRIVWENPSGAASSLEAGFVLDCSGRAGVLARRGSRVPEPRCATVALSAVWKRSSWRLDDPTHTLVASYDRGWAWSIPVSPRLRHFTVMVDPASPRPKGDLGSAYLRELRRVAPFAALIDGAARQTPPWGSDASVYTARRFASEGFLLVGDAGSAIDPLSSAGVKKALASAWMAAVVARTCLTKPELAAAALDLFEAREREMYASMLAHAVRFYREAAAAHPHPFWTERAAVRADPGSWEDDEETLKRAPDVLAAFEKLKAAHSIRLRAHPDLRIERSAAIAGRDIALADTLIAPGAPSGLRFLGGVDLPKLVELAPAHRSVPDLYEAYDRSARPVALPSFLLALSVMIAKRLVLFTAT